MTVIQPTMTEARARWLERLAQGPAQRDRTVVGAQVMQLGWTEWDDGGERLTEAGWAALRQHRERMAKLAVGRSALAPK